jgi:hypothetical protein
VAAVGRRFASRRAGHAAVESNAVAALLGRPPIGFDELVQDSAETWR